MAANRSLQSSAFCSSTFFGPWTFRVWLCACSQAQFSCLKESCSLDNFQMHYVRTQINPSKQILFPWIQVSMRFIKKIFWLQTEDSCSAWSYCHAPATSSQATKNTSNWSSINENLASKCGGENEKKAMNCFISAGVSDSFYGLYLLYHKCW